jgi:hypothetical protein
MLPFAVFWHNCRLSPHHLPHAVKAIGVDHLRGHASCAYCALAQHLQGGAASATRSAKHHIRCRHNERHAGRRISAR